MTSRERVATAIGGGHTDRPALAYMFLGGAHGVLDHVGINMDTAYHDPDEIARCHLAAKELFGHDAAMVPWGCLTVEAEAFGCTVQRHDRFYPQVVSRPLEQDPTLSGLTDPDPSTTARMPLMLEALGRLRERAGDDLYIIGMVVSPFLVAAEVRGMTNFMLDLARDPPYANDLMATITAGIIGYTTAMIDLGACDAIMFENAGATRDLIGPHHVDQFVNPYHRQVLAAARAADPGVALIEHNCSDRPYLDDALTSDVDAISLAETDTSHLFDAHQWNNRTAITPPARRAKCYIGGIDHTRLVLNGPPSAIYDRTRALVNELHDHPAVISTGCEIPFKAPVANIQALSAAVRAS